jgi:hypothetical protein
MGRHVSEAFPTALAIPTRTGPKIIPRVAATPCHRLPSRPPAESQHQNPRLIPLTETVKVTANIRGLSISMAIFLLALHSLFLLSDDGNRFTSHPSKKTRRRHKHPVRAFAQESVITTSVLPPDAIPADNWAEPNKHVIPDVISSIAPLPSRLQPHFTWPTYLRYLQTWERELLESITVIRCSQLLTAFRTDDMLFMASDGGASDKKASFGALLTTSE